MAREIFVGHRRWPLLAALLTLVSSSQQQASTAPISPSRSQPLPSSLGGKSRFRERVAHRLRRFYREAKAWTSSDFEAALLKSTRPDSLAPKAKHVESIVLSVSAFEAFVAPDCDPYALLLHKIWSRLVEPSPFTVAKAIYLYRRVLCHPSLFRARRVLARQRSSKSKTAYFDTSAVLDVRAEEGLDLSQWQPFLRRYWAFVDAAWLSLSSDDPPSSSDDASSRLPAVAADAATLATFAAAVLFPTRKNQLRVPPSSPLVDACVLQVVEDLYALHFVLLLCFSLDPLRTLDAAARETPHFWQLLRNALDHLHRPRLLPASSPSLAAAAGGGSRR